MYRGMIVSIAGDKLVASDRDGRARSNTLAPDAVVTCDGKTCGIGDLREGMKIRVTTKEDARSVAIRIEALDKIERFEKRN